MKCSSYGRLRCGFNIVSWNNQANQALSLALNNLISHFRPKIFHNYLQLPTSSLLILCLLLWACLTSRNPLPTPILTSLQWLPVAARILLNTLFLSHKAARPWLAASHSALLNHTTYPDHVSLSSSPSFPMKGVHLLTSTNVSIHDLSVVKQTPSHSFKDTCQFLVLFYLNVTKHGVHNKYSFYILKIFWSHFRLGSD